MRSFSNLWYWIGLAVLWSSSSYFTLGIPNDMIQRARREGGQVQADVETLAQINARRALGLARNSALVALGVLSFLLTSLILLAFVYDSEFSQAVFFLLGPMVPVAALRLALARRIELESPVGDELFHMLRWHRFTLQIIGLFAIFITAMYGMYQNLFVPHGF